MRFREAREAKNLSQKYVAITLGVKPPNVSRWEAGVTYPTVENLIKLANLYGVPVDYLLGLDDGTELRASADEKEILAAYRCASADTRKAVQAVLGVPSQEDVQGAV